MRCSLPACSPRYGEPRSWHCASFRFSGRERLARLGAREEVGLTRASQPPVLAQGREQALAQHGVAVLGAFAGADVDEHATCYRCRPCAASRSRSRPDLRRRPS